MNLMISLISDIQDDTYSEAYISTIGVDFVSNHSPRTKQLLTLENFFFKSTDFPMFVSVENLQYGAGWEEP